VFATRTDSCCATSRRGAPGERIACRGDGAGKSTLISLLLASTTCAGTDPGDGVDVRDLPSTELRGLFGLVLQDVHLFSGTIGRQHPFGHTGITDEQVRRAARAVQQRLHRAAAARLRDGRRRARRHALGRPEAAALLCARARPSTPRPRPDEATSSVDTDTELLIRDALHVLIGRPDTIAIAHRLSTIQDMDKILVLHKASCARTGTTSSCSRSAGSLAALPAAVQGPGAPGHGSGGGRAGALTRTLAARHRPGRRATAVAGEAGSLLALTGCSVQTRVANRVPVPRQPACRETTCPSRAGSPAMSARRWTGSRRHGHGGWPAATCCASSPAPTPPAHVSTGRLPAAVPGGGRAARRAGAGLRGAGQDTV